MFLGLSLGGLVSFYFSNRISLPDQVTPPLPAGNSLSGTIRNYRDLLRSNPAFVSFATKRFVFFSALALSAPIMPLYLVREVGASDSQIGSINMLFTLVMLVGYFLWPRVSKYRGGRFVLLATTLGMSLYPALTATTHHVESIMVFAAIAGLFQAGLDLVFFDELLKTIPAEYSATFVSLAQSMQYLAMVIAPLVGTFLATYIGLGGALWLSAGLRLLGFLLFLRRNKTSAGQVAA
jgi:MFS family permease